MKWTIAAGLMLMVVCGACETQVKPADSPTSAAPLPSWVTQDQTPDFEQHTQSQYNGRSSPPSIHSPEARKSFDPPKAEGERSPDGFAATVNRYCPIMQRNALGRFTSVEHTVQFEGQTVGFCCDDCPDTWKVMSDDERRTALKAVFSKE